VLTAKQAKQLYTNVGLNLVLDACLERRGQNETYQHNNAKSVPLQPRYSRVFLDLRRQITESIKARGTWPSGSNRAEARMPAMRGKDSTARLAETKRLTPQREYAISEAESAGQGGGVSKT